MGKGLKTRPWSWNSNQYARRRLLLLVEQGPSVTNTLLGREVTRAVCNGKGGKTTPNKTWDGGSGVKSKATKAETWLDTITTRALTASEGRACPSLLPGASTVPVLRASGSQDISRTRLCFVTIIPFPFLMLKMFCFSYGAYLWVQRPENNEGVCCLCHAFVLKGNTFQRSLHPFSFRLSGASTTILSFVHSALPSCRNFQSKMVLSTPLPPVKWTSKMLFSGSLSDGAEIRGTVIFSNRKPDSDTTYRGALTSAESPQQLTASHASLLWVPLGAPPDPWKGRLGE